MLPGDGQLSDAPPAPFRTRRRESPLVDYEMGGVALSDTTEGSLYQLWKVSLSGDNVQLSAPNTPPMGVFSKPEITEISLAFDQNMNPFVAFVSEGRAGFWWFDTIAQAQVFTQMDADVVTPRCTLDDKRKSEAANSDIILAYIRGNGLYYRQQRDRYQTEYLLQSDAGPALHDVQMASNFRLQFVVTR